MGQRLALKNGEHSAARGSSCVLELHVYKLAGEGVRDGSSVTGRRTEHWAKAYVKKWRAFCRARGFVRARTRLLHVYKLGPCWRCSSGEGFAETASNIFIIARGSAFYL